MRYIVFGGGGFIGSYLVNKLKLDKHYVIAIDRHISNYVKSDADEFHVCADIGKDIPIIAENIDGVFQLCAQLGGSEVIDNGSQDADIFMNNMMVNISVIKFCIKYGITNIFFASSACVYSSKDSSVCDPVNFYGWEKYSSEKLYYAAAKQYNLNVRIGRIFNIYGPNQVFCGGKERVISALCYKTYMSTGVIRALGSGDAERSFLHVADCADAIVSIFNSNVIKTVNIGSDITTRIADIANMILIHAHKEAVVEFACPNQAKNVRGCDNSVLKSLGWSQKIRLEDGVAEVYQFVKTSLTST
jgi:GDP-D-mannose 3',5'-epimerase